MKTVKMFVLLAVALAVLIWATGGSGFALASRAYSWAFPTYKVSSVMHVVHHGESIYSIALLYADQQDRWDDLRGVMLDIEKANGLASNDAKWLVPGRTLVIPLAKEVK